jgi:hypothetical protein
MSMKAMVAMVMMGLLMPIAAIAQEWKAYRYPDPGFAVQFPAEPTVEKATAKTSNYHALPMTRYTVRQDRITYTVSVVDYSTTNADPLSTIAETERALGASGKVTVAIGARINRSFGRELSISGTDGSRSAIAIFYVDKHLYTLVGQALPPNAIEKSGDAIRFQESLQFLGDNGGFGFGGFFGRLGGGGGGANGNAGAGAGSSASASASASVGGGAGGGGGGGTGGGGGGRFRGGFNPQAQAACVGKSAGDVVQLETPGGPVAATCTLVARPNMPPNGPPGTQNPDGRQGVAPN